MVAAAVPADRPKTLALLLDDIQDRFRGFEPPHGRFNPSQQEPSALRRFGIPPRPDAKTQPLLRELWNRLFDRDVSLRQLEKVELLDLRGLDYRPFIRPSAPPSLGATRFETSSNWSGAYVSASQGRQFVQVWGFWTVPDKLKLPPGIAAPTPGDPAYACSSWIGLDGQRRYFNASLPQIGTGSSLDSSGATIASAWTQWWSRGDLDSIQLPLKGFTVAAGDPIGCVVTVLAPHIVLFVIANLAPSPIQIMPVLGFAPMAHNPPYADAQPAIAGATAEWILERPRVPHSTLLNKFPDYGQSAFDLCVAVEGEGPCLLSSELWTPQTLQGARLIRMFDRRTDPDRTDFISMPWKAGDLGLRLTYGSF